MSFVSQTDDGDPVSFPHLSSSFYEFLEDDVCVYRSPVIGPYEVEVLQSCESNVSVVYKG